MVQIKHSYSHINASVSGDGAFTFRRLKKVQNEGRELKGWTTGYEMFQAAVCFLKYHQSVIADYCDVNQILCVHC